MVELEDEDEEGGDDQVRLHRRGTIFVNVSVPFFTLHVTVLVTGCGQKSLLRIRLFKKKNIIPLVEECNNCVIIIFALFTNYRQNEM